MSLKIKHRLWLIALAALATFGLTFAVGSISSRVVGLLEHGALQHSVSTLRTIAEVSDLLHKSRYQTLEVLALAPDARNRQADIDRQLSEIRLLMQKIDEVWTSEYQVGHEDDIQELELVTRFNQTRNAWSASVMSLGAATRAGITDVAALNEFIRLGEPALDEASSILGELREHQVVVGNQVLSDAEELQSVLESNLIVLGIVGGLALAILAFMTAGRIRRGMNDAARVAEAIAEGNLDVDVRRDGNDEFDNLLVQLGRMRDSLKQMLHSVRQSEGRTHAVLRTMRDGVIQIAPDGIILSVNDIMTELFGYEEHEMIGKNVSMLMPEAYAREHDGYLARYRSSRIAHILHRRVELEAKRADGSIFPIDLVVNEMVDDHGSVFIGVVRDIVEQKETQKALEVAVTEARSAAEAKSAFLANMSHEIRTPINAVIGFALLAQRLDLDGPVRTYFEKISASAQALLAIINDILDLSKIEAGKLDIESIEFSLDESLKHVHTLLSHKANAKGIELVVGAMPDVPVRLIGDPTRLSQVLVNLCSNAVKFTEHGQVSVLVERLPGDGCDADVCLRFAVKDSGIGIPEAQQAKLFQSFTQVDSSTSRKFGGTGLGLAICKELVERMGGRIGFDSEAGKGAEFWFELPFARAARDNSDAEPARSADLTGKRVLVVDDNAVIRTLMKRMLGKLGCEVVLVGDGEAAVSQVSGESFDAVALDWQLPGMDGLAAARQMRAKGFSGPIVMVTGMGDESLPDVGDAVNAVLQKPVSLEALREVLVNVLNGNGVRTDRRLMDAVIPDLGGRRVLVVDDNEFNREIAAELLNMADAEVETAVNGEKAVSAVLGDHYDLVLMDVQMPVMDGYEASRLIRRTRPDLPIIALTAHAMKEERDRVLAAGMNDLLTKPIDHQAFYRLLQRWMPGDKPETVGQSRSVSTPVVAPRSGPSGAVAGALAASSVARGVAASADTADESDVTIFDRAGALARVGGSAEMLERFMGMFWDKNAQLVAEIGAALTRGDRDEARRGAHALKGGAGTVGLVELEKASAALETALKATNSDVPAEAELKHRVEVIESAWARAREATQAALDI